MRISATSRSRRSTFAVSISAPAPIMDIRRGAAMLFLGFSMQAIGQAQAAERLLLAEYESYGDKTNTYALLVLESLCFIYLNTGQLEQTRRIAQVLFQGSTRSGIAFMRNLGEWYLGLVCYQCNELEAATQHFSQVVENRYTVQVTTYRDAVAGLVLIHQIQGESSKAWQMVKSISQYDLEQKGSEDTRTGSPARPADALARGPGRRRSVG